MSFSLSDDELAALYEDQRFKSLVNSVESSNARFRDLPKKEKYIAASLIFSGKADVIPNLWKLFFRRRIPSISDFLSSDYIGDNALFYPKQEGEVGYVWRKELETVFAPDSAIYLLIVSGSIGSAKTSACMVGHFYNLFRVTSLLRPQLSMGASSQKPMALSLMSVTEDKAYETMMEPLKNLLDDSKYFYNVSEEQEFNEILTQSEGQVVPYFEHKRVLHFPNDIRVTCGSREHHAVGEDLFGASLDEAEMRLTNKGAEQTADLFSKLVERIRSRFMGSKYIFATLISSIGEESGVMAQMIKNVQPDDPYRRVVRYSIWDVRFPKEMAKGHFYVFRGTRSFPSRVLDDFEAASYENGKLPVPAGCRVIKVPNVYRNAFMDSPNRALRDLAGVETTSEDYPFGRIEDAVDPQLQAEIFLILSLGDKKRILDYMPSNMFITTPDGQRLRRYPHSKRYIHIDLAQTGAAAIGCVHKERSKFNDIMYIVDFIIRIETTTQIPIDSITEFIRDLRRLVQVPIQILTADSYQSASLMQYITVRKLAETSKILSVDRTLDAYNNCLEILNEGCLKFGEAPILINEMKNVYFSGDKPFSNGRKDEADAIVGCLYNAVMNPMDIPSAIYDHNFVYGKNIELIPENYIEMTF